MEKKLAGKVALITGGGRGLGLGYALRLADLGADVAIIDRNMQSSEVYEFEKDRLKADTPIQACTQRGVRAMGVETDLTDREATFSAFSEVQASLGSIDVLVCNAGGGVAVFADEQETPDGAQPKDIATSGSPSDCPQDVLRRVLEINLMTCMYSCMAAAQYMKEQRSGKIVTVSSVGGLQAKGTGYHPYGLSKAAIIHYTRNLAQELGPFNINVNCIAPGTIRTGRLGDKPWLDETIPLRRQGTVEDCAKVVEFLATDLSDYVTGKTITVDGGACDQR